MRLVESRKMVSVGIEPKQMSYQRLRRHNLIVLFCIRYAAEPDEHSQRQAANVGKRHAREL